MNVNFIKLLLVINIFLIVILITEYFWFDGKKKLPDITPVEQTTLTQLKLPEIILTRQAIDSYLDMVDRPLFVKGRRPVDNTQTVNTTQDTRAIKDVILVGIYALGRKKIALFQPKVSHKPHIKKTEGEKLSNWIIKKIKSDHVILQQGGKQQTIKLRKPKPQQPNKFQPKPKLTRPVNPFVRKSPQPES